MGIGPKWFSWWIFPVIGSIVWVGTIVAMFVTWVLEGYPHYVSFDQGQNIAYISDVGADILKPLFVTGSCVTAVCFAFSLIAERWLRHQGRIIKNTSWHQRLLAYLAIIGCFVGAAGLILLSIFDTRRHVKLHRVFLAVFVGGVLVSAICTVLEFWRLEAHHRTYKGVVISFWIKAVFFVVELALAIAFGVLMTKEVNNVGAILEWVVALIFTGYLISFLFDLLPATKSRPGKFTKDLEQPAEMSGRNF